MKKYLVLFLLWPFLANAQEWVLRDSVSTRLVGLDIDTVIYVFPTSPFAQKMQSDTTKAGVTAWRPPSFIRAAGDLDLWLDRTNVVGTADSFKLYYKPIDPYTGRPARNESTFVLGSSTTFANFTSTSRYAVTLGAGFGIAFIIRQGDTSIDTTRVFTKLVYSQ